MCVCFLISFIFLSLGWQVGKLHCMILTQFHILYGPFHTYTCSRHTSLCRYIQAHITHYIQTHTKTKTCQIIRLGTHTIRKTMILACLLQMYQDSKIFFEITSSQESHGLVVLGDNSCSRGRGFKCRRHTLDGHDIFTLICVKIVVFKTPKINETEAGD